MEIRCRAPVRISFGGGGTDVSPFCERKGGCVVNATINKYVWATLSFRDDGKIVITSDDFGQSLTYNSVEEMTYDGNLDLVKAVIKKLHINHNHNGFNIFLRSDVPPRSGLGSSASAFVSVIGLFNHLLKDKRMTEYEIAELAYELERKELKNMGGRQDQYAASFGGINFIEFKGDDFVRVTRLRLSPGAIMELEKNLILVNVGVRKDSGDIIKDQIKRQEKTDEAFDLTKKFAIEMKAALLREDFETFGNLLHESWEEKKKFSPMISNEYIDKLYETARKYGAIGGKVSGAGGGGHMLFYCKPNTEKIVSRELEKLGAKSVEFSFTFKGVESWEVK